MRLNKYIDIKNLKFFLLGLTIIFYLYIFTPSILFFFRDSNQGAQLSKAQEILNGYHPFIDILGNTIKKWEKMELTPGTQKIRLELQRFNAGFYLLKANIDGHVTIKRIRKL